MANSKLSIGITGGIGSGKSHISRILSGHFAIPVYDCDKEAKRLTASSGEIRRQLAELVGAGLYGDSGMDRQLLADYLFAGPEHAARVNAIVHPAVLRDFSAWAARQAGPVVALESAILYESGLRSHVDYVLFVDAPEETRLRRAMRRDNATEAQVRARMRMQRPEQCRRLADFVIDNGTADDPALQEQLKNILQTLMHTP